MNFIILTFINENNKYFKILYKIWNKFISFDVRKRVKCKTNHGKSKEKSEFGNPRNESLRFKCGILIMFRLANKGLP